MIYRTLLTEGDINIMQCSSPLNKETSELLFDNGTCRLNLNFAEHMELVPAIDPTQELADKIQNLSTRVNTRTNGVIGRPIPQVDILSKFSGSEIKRKHCTVSFECWPTTSSMVARDVLMQMKSFPGFVEVWVKIDIEWMGEAWPENLYDFQVHQIKGRIYRGFREADDTLKPSLGEADKGWDGDDRCLIFYPRKAENKGVEASSEG